MSPCKWARNPNGKLPCTTLNAYKKMCKVWSIKSDVSWLVRALSAVHGNFPVGFRAHLWGDITLHRKCVAWSFILGLTVGYISRASLLLLAKRMKFPSCWHVCKPSFGPADSVIFSPLRMMSLLASVSLKMCCCLSLYLLFPPLQNFLWFMHTGNSTLLFLRFNINSDYVDTSMS